MNTKQIIEKLDEITSKDIKAFERISELKAKGTDISKKQVDILLGNLTEKQKKLLPEYEKAIKNISSNEHILIIIGGASMLVTLVTVVVSRKMYGDKETKGKKVLAGVRSASVAAEVVVSYLIIQKNKRMKDMIEK